MAKSWSAMRKKLEQDNICDSLRGRIKYHLAVYRQSHDGEKDNFVISLDREKVFETSWFAAWYAEGYADADMRREHPGLEYRQYREMLSGRTGEFNHFDLYRAFDEYENQSIEDSLNSENAIVMLFAFYDTRTGKRRLEKLAEQVKQLPGWLYELIKIRYDAEEIKL